MRGINSSNLTRSRSAVSTKIVAAAVVLIILVAGVAGYFLFLRPGSSTTTGSVTTSTGAPGSSASNPVSAVALYNYYGLGGVPTDYKFTNHTIYATGNLTSVTDYGAPQKLFSGNQVMTGVFTKGNDFEYWYWQNATGIPSAAANQFVLANCFVKGLAPYGNGSSILYLDNCNLISIKNR